LLRGAFVIRQWLSPRKEQNFDHKSATRGSIAALQQFWAFLSSPVPGIGTIERLTWLLVALGVLLRVLEYASYRRLYLDEASLLKNLTGLAVFDFHTTLSEEQLAPPGFLVVERISVRLRLDSVWSARFFPLVCGAGSVFLMRLVALRFLSRPAVPIAVGLFALSDWLLYYSAEIKQYSTDVALTLVAVLLAARFETVPGSERMPAERKPPLECKAPSDPEAERALRGKLLALAIFGTVGVWFSHPLAFVLAGVGTYVMASAAIRRDRKSARRALVISMVWAASFAGCFAVSHAILTRGQFIWIWWDFAFLPLPPRSAADLERDFWQIVNVFDSPSDVVTPLGVLPSAFLALGLFVIGALALGWSWPGGLYLLVSPLLFALMASALRQYPFHGRLLLFLVPTIHLLVAEGAASVALSGSRLVRGLAARLPNWTWIKTVLTCICALIVVSPAFLLYQPAVDVVGHYIFVRRFRTFDSHGDLRNDLLDYREKMQRKARGR
jgi:hypothetical protein